MTNRKNDVERLKRKEVRVQYETSIGRKFAALADRDDIDAEQILIRFKTTTNEVAKEMIGLNRRQQKTCTTETSRALSEKHKKHRSDDEMDVERKACLRVEKRTTLDELHSRLKDDENKF